VTELPATRPRRVRLALRWAALVCVLAAPGCDALEGPAERNGGPASPPEFASTFTKIAPSGYVDMSLEVANPTDGAVLIEGRLVARDASGDELPDVAVASAFGIERGRMVLMPGADIDFVRVEGADQDLVEDVTLEEVRSRPVGVPPADQPVELTTLDAEGRELEYDAEAVAARLDNPNDVPVRVRIVLLVLAAPVPGVPQQAVQVEDVTTVDIAPSASQTVRLDRATLRVLRRQGYVNFVSLRPVFGP